MHSKKICIYLLESKVLYCNCALNQPISKLVIAFMLNYTQNTYNVHFFSRKDDV